MSKSYSRRNLFQMAGVAAATMLGKPDCASAAAEDRPGGYEGIPSHASRSVSGSGETLDRSNCPGRQSPQDDL